MARSRREDPPRRGAHTPDAPRTSEQGARTSSPATSAPPMPALRPTDRPLVVPSEVLVATWQALRMTAGRGVEATVRWAGPASLVSASVHVITTVIVPGQRGDAGSFVIPHASTRAMGEALRVHQLVNYAQLHTHPGTWVGHSAWDDAQSYSRREGALSIVWPTYGTVLPMLGDWGVHECRNGTWVQLRGAALRRRLVIIESVLDLRVCNGSVHADAMTEEDHNAVGAADAMVDMGLEQGTPARSARSLFQGEISDAS